MRIRISAPWDTSENITNRVLRQFKTPEINLTNIKFVYDESYDIAVCFNYICLEINSNKQYYVFPMEPFWNGVHQKVYKEPNCTVFGFCKEGYIGNNIVTPAHTFYGGRGPWVDKLDIWNCDNIFNTNFINKTKGISSCITDINFSYGLYPKRVNVLNQLNESSYIEFFGLGEYKCKSKNDSPRKIDCTKNFKFNLSIENECRDNWVTERFFDAILTDCIPIYYGCSNIKELFPEDGYILLDNIDDMKYVQDTLSHINNNMDKIYNQKIIGARQIKERYFKDHNLLKKIIEIL
tara:strand:- start:947 stop:1825 length:879 start_codon:yes stop_codon:yes gene_type:complete